MADFSNRRVKFHHPLSLTGYRNHPEHERTMNLAVIFAVWFVIAMGLLSVGALKNQLEDRIE